MKREKGSGRIVTKRKKESKRERKRKERKGKEK